MTSELKGLFLERIATGLKRQSVTTAAKWAEQYRMMKTGPWRFTRHPWLREMHNSKSIINIGKKAAQVGYTETVLNITFFNIDVLGRDVLYVLPNRTPDASDFSASRFDPALELSPHLAKLFSNVKNVGHKRAGAANLYIRGSQSRAGLKSIPVSLVVLDEIEEFNEEAVPLALERTSGQLEKQIWMISTPTIEDTGIDKYYKQSTQEHFMFKCPSCSKIIELIWPESFDTDAQQLKCFECGNILPHEKKTEYLKNGFWRANNQSDIRGFYINQLYSSMITPKDFAIAHAASLLNPADEQEFYNSKLGLTHAVKGAQLAETDILQCEKGYDSGPRPGIITMGVDVGKFLHYEIDQWILPQEPKTRDLNMECVVRVLEYGKLLDFEDLDNLMRHYNIRFCVIDAQPERRKAKEFATRFNGRVRLCFYGRGINGKQIHIHNDEPTITVDRTSWLDLSLSRFRNKTITLPKGTDREYVENLRALVRRYKKDASGNPIAEYVNGDKPDHYGHSRTYAEMGLPFAASLARNYDITGNVL